MSRIEVIYMNHWELGCNKCLIKSLISNDCHRCHYYETSWVSVLLFIKWVQHWSSPGVVRWSPVYCSSNTWGSQFVQTHNSSPHSFRRNAIYRLTNFVACTFNKTFMEGLWLRRNVTGVRTWEFFSGFENAFLCGFRQRVWPCWSSISSSMKNWLF